MLPTIQFLSILLCMVPPKKFPCLNSSIEITIFSFWRMQTAICWSKVNLHPYNFSWFFALQKTSKISIFWISYARKTLGKVRSLPMEMCSIPSMLCIAEHWQWPEILCVSRGQSLEQSWFEYKDGSLNQCLQVQTQGKIILDIFGFYCKFCSI